MYDNKSLIIQYSHVSKHTTVVIETGFDVPFTDGLQADVLNCTVTSYGEPNASPVQGYTSEPRIFYTASNTIAGNMTFDDPTVTVSENVQYLPLGDKIVAIYLLYIYTHKSYICHYLV